MGWCASTHTLASSDTSRWLNIGPARLEDDRPWETIEDLTSPRPHYVSISWNPPRPRSSGVRDGSSTFEKLNRLISAWPIGFYAAKVVDGIGKTCPQEQKQKPRRLRDTGPFALPPNRNNGGTPVARYRSYYIGFAWISGQVLASSRVE